MLLRRLLRRRRRGLRRAVIASTGRFPVGSHTFVYEEVMGLARAGFDIKILCLIHEPEVRMHASYRHLMDHYQVMPEDWSLHLRDVDWFRRRVPGRLESFLDLVSKASGVPVPHLEQHWLVVRGCTFARMASEFQADYIHTYFFYDQSFFGMLAAWLLDVPRGITCYADHMMDDFEFKLVSLHVETADLIVATSRRIREELIGIAGESHAHKILVKPNGVDGRMFRRRSHSGEVGALEAVSVSRLEPKKGLMTLVEAAGVLSAAGVRFRMHVVGDADRHSGTSREYARRFRERIGELGLQDRFVLHGYKTREEIAEILARSDVFVAPYEEVESGDKDGIPTAVLEAMAAGLPVAGTDAGSIREVIAPGVEGFLVGQRDAAGLAEALGSLAMDPSLRLAMGERARCRFDAEFDVRVTEGALHERIMAVLNERAGVRR